MINEFFKNILSQENLKCSFGFKADNAEPPESLQL